MYRCTTYALVAHAQQLLCKFNRHACTLGVSHQRLTFLDHIPAEKPSQFTYDHPARGTYAASPVDNSSSFPAGRNSPYIRFKSSTLLSRSMGTRPLAGFCACVCIVSHMKVSGPSSNAHSPTLQHGRKSTPFQQCDEDMAPLSR